MSNIKNEMLVHVPLTVYPNAKNVLLLAEDKGLETEISKHNAQIVKETTTEEKVLDVAILEEYNKEEFIKIYRSLKDDGILVVRSADWNSEEIKEQLKLLDLFRFVIPYRYDNYENGGSTVIFASKKYHPTADIRLHCADMLDGLEYYNGDLHKASFVMPNFIFNNTKEFLKL